MREKGGGEGRERREVREEGEGRGEKRVKGEGRWSGG